MLSVNTNTGAMIALQNLTKTNSEMEQTQNRINTGLKVATAKDNGGIYAIAQTMRGDVGAFNAVGQSLNRAKSIVDVALAAGETISDLIVQMKEKAVAAADMSTDTTARAALNEDFVALRKQVASIVANASFNNVNIINASTTRLTTLASASGSVLTVMGENLSLGGSIITVASTGQIDTQTAASTMLATIGTSLSNVNRALARLGLEDFRRWYDAARKPKKAGEPERLRKAHGLISMVRRIVAYGVAAELSECPRLSTILKATEFEAPAPRREKLTLAHVEAFIAKAIEGGRLSLALGTALQFETTLRQRDVIGEWRPLPAGAAASGIVLGGRRWTNGLTWADLSSDFELYKQTTKTGAIAAHDLKLCPLTMKMIALVAADRRVGPIIMDETAGRPYAEHAYAREWRAVAEKAGIPKGVWNMDARAGGISEADDAGADLDDIRSAAAHSQASTTARYVRGTIGKSRKVARLRAAHRAERTSND